MPRNIDIDTDAPNSMEAYDKALEEFQKKTNITLDDVSEFVDAMAARAAAASQTMEDLGKEIGHGRRSRQEQPRVPESMPRQQPKFVSL